MKEKDKTRAYRKPVIIGAVSITAVIALSVTAYAWFTNQRRLDTITKINAPNSLSIGAGAKEDSVYIDMGGIDVDTGTYKDFVFCVFSDETAGAYKIQLAHTTNIGFTYTIYKSADDGNSENYAVLYTDQLGNPYYYTKKDRLIGDYINKELGTSIANTAYHEKSYGDYSEVQKNAEPLYWQNKDPIEPTPSGEGGFVDYYILEVSWDNTVENDKETDMVYITAGLS